MKIKQIKIKNFKSFGNNENILKLSNKGELILLMGKNGNGKSSVIDAIDFAIFGKVRGKKSKTVPLTHLPNRFNKDLRVELDFESYKEEINIVRTVNPSKLILTANGETEDKAGKSHKQTIIENKVGLDFDTFKSFISMSINDFKNFMTLTPEEKRVLLDRLFNLEMINDISKILKQKKKEHVQQIELFETEIRTYESSLREFKESIENVKEATKKNIESEIEETKNLILSKKDDFNTFKERLEKCDEKEQELRNLITENNTTLSETVYKIKDYKSKIEIYDSGSCPTCGSELSGETHHAYREEMKQTIEKLKETYKQLKKEEADYSEKSQKLNKIRRDSQTAYSELKAYLADLKRRIEKLQSEQDSEEESANINQLLESINNIEDRKVESKDKLDTEKDTTVIVNELTKLFSSDGIKRSIISKIVKPINHFIKESLNELNMEFHVELDDDFSAKIYQLGEEVHVESPSTGETKKINIAIMLAYLKLIRMKKHINVLFLDEIFASIDVEGIYDILSLLKKFANDYSINIFLVHHAMLDKSAFDRVIKIEKNITSNIVEEE
jgi:exonuclease SbcC